MKYIKKLLIVFILIISISAVSADNDIVDQLGRKVLLKKETDKIIVLFPQAMAIVFVLDIQKKIVGFPDMMIKINDEKNRDYYKKIAPELFNAVDIGYPGKPNIEIIIALKPDLIIAPAHFMKCSEKLIENSMPLISVYCGFGDIETWFDAVHIIGRCTNKTETAESYIKYSKSIMKEIKERIKTVKYEKRPKTVYLSSWANKIVMYGKRTEFAYDIIKLAGGRIPEELEYIAGNSKFNPETLIKWNPDIIISSSDFSWLKNKKWWKNLKAVKEKKVFVVPQYGSNVWLTNLFSTNNFPVGLYWLSKNIYPEKFKDIDIRTKWREFSEKIYGMRIESVIDDEKKN